MSKNEEKKDESVIEIPVYQSKVTISAIEIAKVDLDSDPKNENPNHGGATLFPKDKKIKEIRVNNVFLNKNPKVSKEGGFLVFDENGKRFESKEDFANQWEEEKEISEETERISLKKAEKKTAKKTTPKK